MKFTLKPYPVYKELNLLWLKEIPEHWTIQRGKTLFDCIDIRSSTGNEELLTVSSDHGVIPRKSATVTMFKAESYEGYKLCWPGDLVINSLWAWAKGLGVTKYHGIISSAYGVYRLKPNAKVNRGYIHELVRSSPFQWELQVRSKGIWTSRLQLTDDSFLNAPFPIPPSSEQSAIVRYLDYMDRRIRRYMNAKKKLIALLSEQKQAIIHQAVTRGLDSNVLLKPSGVEWLGNIPEHWELRRLKSLGRIRYGLGQPPREKRDGLPLIRATNIAKGHIIEHEMLFVDPTDVPSSRDAFLKEDEIIVVRSGAYTADSAIIPKCYEGSVTGYDMVLKVDKALPEFIAFALLSKYVLNDQLFLFRSRAAQPHLNKEELGIISILIPPLEEQISIVNRIKFQIKEIESLIEFMNHHFSILREYRTRLIADVVTGKLDVREVAANLPEEVEEPLEEINNTTGNVAIPDEDELEPITGVNDEE